MITPAAIADRQIGPRSREYENPYFHVDQVIVEFPDHAKRIFVSEHGQRVGILIAQDARILLVRQYRLLVDGLAWEIPGGRVDAGETPREAAFREAQEESGLNCYALEPLLYFHPGLDTCNNPTFVFLAEKFETNHQWRFAAQEVTDRVWLPLAECLRMIFMGQIVDSLTVSALLAHQVRRQQLDLQAVVTQQFESEVSRPAPPNSSS